MDGKAGRMMSGISRIGIWFLLSCKRHLHRWSFVGILLLLPLVTFLIRENGEDRTRIRIAVCVQEEPSFGRGQQAEKALEGRLMEALVNRQEGEGLFCFYPCESQQQVRDEVASRRAECGYVISAGLQGLLEEKKFRRSIRVYSAPSTVAARLSSEVVFAALIQLYDRDLFEKYAAEALEAEGKSGSGTEQEIRQLYDKWAENGSTFRFTYETVDGKGQTVKDRRESPVFPVRGVVAVYLLVVGLYSGAIYLSDEKKHLFLAVSWEIRTGCRLAGMAAPVFLAGISGLAALFCGHVDWRGAWEPAALAGYGVLVLLFSWILCLICRREALICCLIPFFVIGSLVFCPVFLDVGKYIPEFEFLENFFLPAYYLKLF